MVHLDAKVSWRSFFFNQMQLNKISWDQSLYYNQREECLTVTQTHKVFTVSVDPQKNQHNNQVIKQR